MTSPYGNGPTLVTLSVTPASANPVLDPVTQEFLDRLPTASPPTLQAFREQLGVLQGNPPAVPHAPGEDLTITAGRAGAIRMRILRPRTGASRLPVIAYFSGGGTGGIRTHDRLLRELAAGSDAAVILIEEGHAAEHPLPERIERNYAVLAEIAARAAGLGLDETRLAVAGDGIGGTLAAAVCLMARERQGPDICLQLLFCPVMACGCDTPSYRMFGNGPWLTRDVMRSLLAEYGVPEIAADSRAFPASASIRQLEGLPAAMVVTAENDVLRDEGETYARKLMQAGVAVHSTRFIGAIHDFILLDALSETPAAQSALAQAIAALRVSFGK
ncbi:alpha/beta hydrolase [Rhizobium puerariae]|uniref:Alpha/beta hydrolase n=1 Tax=Rhizobium puerariae TaxID=1585791 RepID=A0ABV6AES0_9HYPH